MWKWKQLLKQMVIPVKRIPEESEDGGDAGDADTTSSVEDPGESSHTSLYAMLSSANTRSRFVLASPIHNHFRPLPPSPASTLMKKLKRRRRIENLFIKVLE